MTTTVQAPPQAPAPAPRTGPPHGAPRGRRWLFGFWAAVLVAFLAPSPGKMTFETKLGVAADPGRFLGDLGQLWHSRGGFGGISDQYAGYLFPSLPYYGLTDLAHLPTWLAERLWMSLIVAAAFWGALRLAERLGVGTSPTRLLGAVVYALWPTFTIVIGSTSAAALPGAVLPWVLLPLTSPTSAPRVAAARSALAIPFMGGVNAASTLAALLPALLYVATRTGRRRRALLAWWLPGVVVATLWWWVPLLLLGAYGEDFMPYVENAETTTGTMSATEMLRGAGNWTAYLHFGDPWLPAGWTVAAGWLAILGGAAAAALGLAGLARRDLPERRWLLLCVLTVTGVVLAGYGGALGAPFSGTVQDWLDGWLRPFRNIYKFQPGLALALAFGLAHLCAVAVSTRGTRALPGRPLLPWVAALAVLPGLCLPYLGGNVLQPGAFDKLPAHWQQTAAWLEEHSPHTRAYVTPATAHGLYTWGSPIDQPLDVLAASPWAQRDYVPFGSPGNRRATDAVEQALMSGGEVPGLADFLARAGLYYVVVRGDLDPDQLGYVPPQTVKRTLEESGYEKVEAFGPQLTGGRIPEGTPVQVAGFYPRGQAVEIYRPTGVERPERATVQPVSDTAEVSGGPESLLPLAGDPRLKGRPAVLRGDSHPGLGAPALRVRGDGLRRADTRFGLVNTNTSYTYTATERNHPDSLQQPGEEPKQILPTDGVRHQTTSVLRGAASVTASSSGNWLFHLPQFDPVGAFDGNPDTAWAEGTAGEPEGQWIKAEFDDRVDLPASIEVTPLPGDATRAAPTRVTVETAHGSESSFLRPTGKTQKVTAPRGATSWLKLTITDAQTPRPGLSGAGFADIGIPGVQVTRLLKLPTDSGGSGSGGDTGDAGADSELISLHRGDDPGGLAPAASEAGLHRTFSTEREGDYDVRARALPVAGDALDRLLDEAAPGPRERITATADSTARTGRSLSARNLVDGNLSTAWIAGDKPTIRLKWPEKKEIGEIVLAPAGGISAAAEEIRISSPDGAATAGVDKNGQARFEPIETDQLTLTVTKTRKVTVHNPLADRELPLPVGLNEVYLPALDEYRVTAPSADQTFGLPCGKGPMLAVDGTLHATKASGTVRDLTLRRPVDVELCAGEAEDGSLRLDAGRHTVEAGDSGPLALTQVTLGTGEQGAAAAPRGAEGETPAASRASSGSAAPDSEASRAGNERESTVRDWTGDERTVEVAGGPASYLVLHENANEGWKATLDGKELRPLRLDGWQQGFLVPAGEEGTVELEYRPATWYTAGLVAGGLGIAALLGLAFLAPRRGRPLGADDEGTVPAPGPVLGTVALTCVVALVAGPYALIVPALAVLARLRPGILVPVALVAMAGAGVVAALGAGSAVAEGRGAFGHAAQALALLALTAALVTLPARERGAAPGTEPGTPVLGPPHPPFEQSEQSVQSVQSGQSVQSAQWGPKQPPSAPYEGTHDTDEGTHGGTHDTRGGTRRTGAPREGEGTAP
ncbi:alpha-(1-_3)-arabinofuranosyltransferase [Streptomyces tubbatahanensis]|uniref:Alpha-(1->3)-arabinofuranosyltransferase n=1 Tax=Streptomyces tubbatahanensis TaxID=2923272 RepID=A0ABY3XR51_9ACTN|nr:alpha-(1->3)-arabinofuranosyltransferase family protein [Streptomyces tubbatahanensis]UNS96889.1 alpha-(1->3)-arabinofuranosyltransferase [Streptomyces tubbatahanensis]